MRAFVFLMLAVIAQVTVFQHLKELGAAFNIALAIIIIMGFARGDYQRLMLPAFFTGIVLDSMSGAPFGAMTTGLVLATGALSLLTTILGRDHSIHFAAFAFVGSILFSGIVFFITIMARPYAGGMSPIGVFSVIGYNTAGACIAYFFYRWIILLKNRIVGR